MLGLGWDRGGSALVSSLLVFLNIAFFSTHIYKVEKKKSQ